MGLSCQHCCTQHATTSAHDLAAQQALHRPVEDNQFSWRSRVFVAANILEEITVLLVT